ncbi:tryptophan synthase subunit alpha [Streptomyces nanshensis]|uniref:tryptophan synthase subunit alpha n=1 Tax=Streptomyces nanshensis TaxID=518642 RepID=UPI00085C677A|nr:tryptophan synthase subunit alpha [Streptomyces nanshensis]
MESEEIMALTASARALTEVLEQQRQQGTTALAAFVPAGFPDLGGCVALARQAVSAGAEVIELGVPDRRPMLDGPVISRAYRHALRQGTDLLEVMTAVRGVAQEAPVVVLSYYASVLLYGPERFVQDLARAGAAGMMIPDLPGDEAESLQAAARCYGLLTPQFAARRASDLRLAQVAQTASGFAYVPAADAVSGYRGDLVLPDLRRFCTRVRAAGADTLACGIGLSTPERAAMVAPLAELVVAGSTVLEPLLERPDADGADEAARRVAAFAAALSPSPAAEVSAPRRPVESPEDGPELSHSVRAGQHVGDGPARTLPTEPEPGPEPGEPPTGP